jgi:hypothetical protein
MFSISRLCLYKIRASKNQADGLDADDIPRLNARWMAAVQLHGAAPLGLPHL